MIKKIIIVTAAVLVSFTGAFVFAWLTYSAPENPSAPSEESVVTGSPSEQTLPPSETGMDVMAQTSTPISKNMTEEQLKELIKDIRKKMQEYERKVQALTVQEKRLQMAQNVLKEDIGNLTNLRIELASTIANLKSERDKLLKSRLEIEEVEKVNLIAIAATYDKMESSSASKILVSMCKNGQMQNIQARDGKSGFDDAVKILYYMTDRTKAKLLAELANTEPSLAALLNNRLIQIVERD
ncbi:MAG: hypothetical protein JXM79_13355 [Sedimentisphaerales bacterium]|nr:hypothetical protein [Sedimentisphaerales bacterium]